MGDLISAILTEEELIMADTPEEVHANVVEFLEFTGGRLEKIEVLPLKTSMVFIYVRVWKDNQIYGHYKLYFDRDKKMLQNIDADGYDFSKEGNKLPILKASSKDGFKAEIVVSDINYLENYSDDEVILNDKQTEERVELLHQGIHYIFGTNEKKIIKAFDGLTPISSEQVLLAYELKYKDSLDGATALDMLIYEMQDEDTDLFKVLSNIIHKGKGQRLALTKPKLSSVSNIRPNVPDNMKGVADQNFDQYRPNFKLTSESGEVGKGAELKFTLSDSLSYRAEGSSENNGYLILIKEPNGNIEITGELDDAEDKDFELDQIGTYDLIVIQTLDYEQKRFQVYRDQISVVDQEAKVAENVKTQETQNYLSYKLGLEQMYINQGMGIPMNQKISDSMPYISLDESSRNPTYDEHLYYTYHSPGGKKAASYYWSIIPMDQNSARDYNEMEGFTKSKEMGIVTFHKKTSKNEVSFYTGPLEYRTDQKYIVQCEEYDAEGKPTGMKSAYMQGIFAEGIVTQHYDFKRTKTGQHAQLREEIDLIDAHMKTKFSGEPIQVKARYINKETGDEMALPIFVGKDAKHPDQFALVDLTLSKDYKYFWDDDTKSLLDEFEDGNNYPEGYISIIIPENDLGLEPMQFTFKTDGSTDFATWSSNLSIPAMVLGAAGIVAMVLPVPGSRPVAFGLLSASGIFTAASASFSLADELSKAKPSKKKIVMDSVTIATSVFGAVTAGVGAASNVTFLAFESSTLGKSVMLMNTGMEAIDGMVFAMDSWSTVLDIIKGRISDDEALVRLVQIITSLAINGALLMMPSAQRWRAKKMAPNTEGLPKEAMDEIIKLSDEELKRFNYKLIDSNYKSKVAKNPLLIDEWKNLYDHAKAAYKIYSSKLPNAIEDMKSVAGDLGQVSGRAKRPESALNRLERAVEAGYVQNISNTNVALDNIWDAVGTRIVLNKGTSDEVDQLVNNLSQAIKNGDLAVVSVNSLTGEGGIPYFTQKHLDILDAASIESGKQIKTGSKKYETGYTVGTIYIKYENHIRGELQIIGPKTLELANAEHLVYDAFLGKPYHEYLGDFRRESTREVAEQLIKKVREPAESLSKSQQKEYNGYLSSAYKRTRLLEIGSKTEKSKLPLGIPNTLSVENLLRTNNLLEGLKTGNVKISDAKKFLETK